MGNTPSNQHGSPKPHPNQSQSQNNQHGQPASSSASSKHPNLRLPMPSRNAGSISPSPSNPASPSGRGGSPRRRKSLELPDLNKLSFTPAAPVPTTATHTSHHLAPSTTAKRPVTDSHASATSPASPVSAPKRWQQVLGGHSPLSQGLGAMSRLDPGSGNGKTAPVNMPKGGRSPSRGPVNVPSASPYFPTLPPNKDKEVQTWRKTATIVVPGTDTPSSTTDTPPSESDDTGMVTVPIHWIGGGKVVMLAGNFANNWKGRIPMTKGVNEFYTTLRLRPGQYRLKFIVDDSWRCSKTIPTATDDDGTLVNWIEVEVPKTEEEVKSEWAMDSVPPAKDDNDDSQWTSVIPESVYLYQYLEEFPHMFDSVEEYRTYMASVPHMSPPPQPPVLPRILEKVIVNSDSKSKWDDSHLPGWDHAPPAGLDDNSILAVPNHVVLNHLTASAIKNGTLGVGTTTRYRKKYITTMFFKPTLADLKDDGSQSALARPPADVAGKHDGESQEQTPAPQSQPA